MRSLATRVVVESIRNHANVTSSFPAGQRQFRISNMGRPIGRRQKTISPPFVVAYMTELAQTRSDPTKS